MDVKGLLLDLDDTLYSYAPCHAAGLAAFCTTWEELGLGSPASAEIAYCNARTQTAKCLKNRGASHHRLLYAQLAVEQHCHTSMPALALALAHAYWNAFLQQLRPCDGLIEFLKTAKDRALPVAVVTDMVAEQQLQKLQRLGLSELVTCMVSSEEAGIEKPSPLIFRKALSKLRVKPSRSIWMLGDSLRRDIQPCLNLGLSAALVTAARLPAHAADGSQSVIHIPVLSAYRDAWQLLDHWPEA